MCVTFMPQRNFVPDPGMYCLGFFFNKFSFPYSSCYTQRWDKAPDFLKDQDTCDKVKHTEKPESPAWEGGRSSQDSVGFRSGGQDGT